MTLSKQFETIVPRRFDATGLSGEESRALCASTLGAIVGEVSLEANGDELRSTRGVYCTVGQLRVMTCYFPHCGIVLRGKGETLADGRLMVRSMEGPLLVRQSGQTLNLEPGECLFLSAEVPFEWRLAQGGRIDCGSLPLSFFPATKRSLEHILLRPIPKAHPPLKLLITHAAYLLMRGAHAPGEAEMVAVHFKQVLPMVVEYLQDDEYEDRSSISLSRIKAFIESRLTDTRFDLASVAERFGVTPRHVQKLFQNEGTTFSRYVLKRRLDMARLLILRHVNRPISSIAYETGFGDLSYFNRAFRQNFGTTPSVMRNSSAEMTVLNGTFHPG